jgi:hemerythrin-like domain-containing protein
MLRACHERIQRQCATLAKLAAHLRSDGLSDAARQAAADIHRYFSSAGRQHHADEEQDLFPLLRNAPDLSGLLETLAREHADMESLWLRLDRQLPARSTSSIHGVVEPLLAAPDAIHDLDAFARLAGEFNALCRQHIARENSGLLPQAEQAIEHRTTAWAGRAHGRTPRCQPVNTCRTSVRVLASAPRFSATMRCPASPAARRAAEFSR